MMRTWTFEYSHQVPLLFYLLHQIFFRCHCTQLFFSLCFIVLFLSLLPGPSLVSLQSLMRNKKRYKTTPSQRVNSRDSQFSQCAWLCAVCSDIIRTKSTHLIPSLLCSEICRQLPRPVVRSDGASRQRGAAQCGGMSVCLQRGPGLWRPGDSGLRHEGEDRQKHRTLLFKWVNSFPGFHMNCFTILIIRHATTHNI